MLLAQKGWPHARRAARVAEVADASAESPLESRVRGHLLLAGIPRPVPQRAVAGASGRVYRVDLCWPERWTILEVDGRVEYEDPRSGSAVRAVWTEKRREDDLREAGAEVVRVVAADLVDGSAELGRRVSAAFARAARRRGSVPPEGARDR